MGVVTIFGIIVMFTIARTLIFTVLLLIISSTFPIFVDAGKRDDVIEKPNNSQLFQQYKSFGNWTITCLYEVQELSYSEYADEGILQSCQSVQVFNNTQEQVLRLYVFFSMAQDSKLELTIYLQVPLKSYLKPQIAMRIDDKPPYLLTYNNCNNTGCYAGGFLNEERIKQFKNGKKNVIIFANAQRELVSIELPLNGFFEASEYLRYQTKHIGKLQKLD